jgi:hypothetical protein
MKPYYTATWGDGADLWYVTRHDHAPGSDLPTSTFMGKCRMWQTICCTARAVIGTVAAVRIDCERLLYDTGDPGMITFVGSVEPG